MSVVVTLYDEARTDKYDDVGVFNSCVVPSVGERITLMFPRGQKHYRVTDVRYGVAMEGQPRLTTAEVYVSECSHEGQSLLAVVEGE